MSLRQLAELTFGQNNSVNSGALATWRRRVSQAVNQLIVGERGLYLLEWVTADIPSAEAPTPTPMTSLVDADANSYSIHHVPVGSYTLVSGRVLVTNPSGNTNFIVSVRNLNGDPVGWTGLGNSGSASPIVMAGPGTFSPADMPFLQATINGSELEPLPDVQIYCGIVIRRTGPVPPGP